jgi:hypothetical protein
LFVCLIGCLFVWLFVCLLGCFVSLPFSLIARWITCDGSAEQFQA